MGKPRCATTCDWMRSRSNRLKLIAPQVPVQVSNFQQLSSQAQRSLRRCSLATPNASVSSCRTRQIRFRDLSALPPGSLVPVASWSSLSTGAIGARSPQPKFVSERRRPCSKHAQRNSSAAPSSPDRLFQLAIPFSSASPKASRSGTLPTYAHLPPASQYTQCRRHGYRYRKPP